MKRKLPAIKASKFGTLKAMTKSGLMKTPPGEILTPIEPARITQQNFNVDGKKIVSYKVNDSESDLKISELNYNTKLESRQQQSNSNEYLHKGSVTISNSPRPE